MAPAYGFQAEGRGRRRRQETSALMTLLVPLGHHIARLPNKPPVTLALVGRACCHNTLSPHAPDRTTMHDGTDFATVGAG